MGVLVNLKGQGSCSHAAYSPVGKGGQHTSKQINI